MNLSHRSAWLTQTTMVTLGFLAISFLAACGSAAPSVPIAHVQRGEVATKVTASGALASVTSQDVGFSKAAQLKELGVKVGDIVRPGQVLARQDPFSFQQLLNQAQAQLDQQLAILDGIVHGTTVGGDHRSVDQAQKVLSATKDNVNAIHDRDEAAIEQARRSI